ncbi:MAG TPA: 3-oxoacyl-[acyl-carrier-protein] synthase III C-terminal domain-containing protein [Streptosporangiaceae bacterium]
MYGISGFGYAFGADQEVSEAAGDYVTDPERILRWGCRTFHRAADNVTATSLAASAARDALGRLGLSLDCVDLLALAVSEIPEYLHWDPSAALARELGFRERQTMLLTEGCASGVTGLGLIAGVFAVQAEIDTALFVAVNRVSEFHRNRMNVNNAVHSDGAVAVVLRRGHPRNQWLSTEQFTDPDLCDWFRSDYGGAVAPVPPPGWSSTTAEAGNERIHAHFDKNPRRLREFLGLLSTRSFDVVDRACKRAGISRDALTHLLYLNDSQDVIEDVARSVAIPLDHTNVTIAARHGHMGAADQLTSLGLLLEAGEITPGDVVALSGTSIGMRWYCSLVRIL